MKRKINSFIACVLAALLVISVLPISVFAASADVEIKTEADLRSFAAEVNSGTSYEGKTVLLSVNIYLGGESNPWTPIGTSKSPFKGTFEGNNHVISGLYIASGSNVGLFGYVNGGTVKGVTVKGSVNGSSGVSGVVGYLKAGTVKNCGNNASVKGTSGVGGVVGSLNGVCSIECCYNNGNVGGTVGYIGGVVGQGSNSSKVENCYNVGTVSGPATVGGIGGSHKAYNVSYKNCYHAGTVTDTSGNGNNIGTVVGVTRGNVENCYYLKNSGKNTKGYGTEVETVSASALGSAFVSSSGTPKLSWESSVSTETPQRPAFIESTARSAQLAEYIKAAVKSAKTNAEITGTLLGNEDYMQGASSTATDWMALAMGRFGYYQSGEYCYIIDDGKGYESYLAAMKKYIETTYAENNGILHSAKATEWHRAVVTVSALLGDPTAFGKYNGSSIDLIADGSYNSPLKAGPGTQGLNGWIWGLIAMDTGMYDVPTDAEYSREKFITEILKTQLADGVNGNKYGGWVLGGYGSASDVDMTAMAIQALAPYYNDDTVYTYVNQNTKTEVSKTVADCINEALDRLGAMMNSDAGFSSWNTDNVESIAQVVVALCSLGINPAEDERFVTDDGKTLLDGMLRFKVSNGGFCHVLNGGWNSMANDQATYALVSWWRLENGMRALYDMRDDWSASEKAAIEAAVEAIEALPLPEAADYKAKIKAALELFREVPTDERRYVGNYNELAAALKLVGGEAKLDTNDPYIASVSVTKAPDKSVYFEGESFDTAGMTVTAKYNNGDEVTVTDYSLSVGGALGVGTYKVYIYYGGLKTSVTVTVNEKMPWSGDGTAESPYTIKTADELKELAKRVNKGKTFSGEYFILTSDIDLSSVSSWTPIGQSSAYRFDGVFDGKGFVIDNLYSTSGGLFGYVGNNAVIKNIGVASGEINAPTSSFTGAIAKWSYGADFINCWNGADIYCGGYSGGLIGTVRDGGESIVKGCYNKGSIVSKYSSVGGIIGHLDTTRTGYVTVNVTVSECYNLGNITAEDDAGGIVGRVQDGHTIENCYNAGKITLNDSSSVDGAGGIVGMLTNKNTVKNCYYNSDLLSCGVSGGSDTTVGKTTDEMKSEAFVALLGSGYKADKYALANGGYPLLSWQSTEEADSVDKITADIAAIGTVTLESENTIKAVRAAYDELSSEAKSFVGNIGVLLSAEEALDALKAAANNPSGSEGTDSGSENGSESVSPSTGDGFNISIYFAIMSAGAAVLFVLAVWKKRKAV